MSDTRLLIHADDVGMCHGANTAFRELSAAGCLDGGSVMVPCPWFAEIVEFADDRALDFGIHLTLNSEMGGYRWRPLTNPPAAAGLVDDNGFMWSTVAELRRHCAPEAAEAEMRAQIDRALESGFDVTHADTHMFAAMAPEFCDAYLRIATEYRIPVMLTETFDGETMPVHLGGVDEGPYQAILATARSQGLTVFDQLIETTWQSTENHWDTCQHLFERVGGLTYMALHPTAPGDIEVIDPRTVGDRVGEYVILSDPEFGGWFDLQELERVTWRALRDEWRAQLEA